MKKVMVMVKVVFLLLFIVAVADAQVKMVKENIYEGLDLEIITGVLDYFSKNQDRMTVVTEGEYIDIDIHHCTKLPEELQVGQVISVLALFNKEKVVYHENVALAIDVVPGESYLKDYNQTWKTMFSECKSLFDEAVDIFNTNTLTFTFRSPEGSTFSYSGYIRFSKDQHAIITATSIGGSKLLGDNRPAKRLVAFVHKDTKFHGKKSNIAEVGGSILDMGDWTAYLAHEVIYKSKDKLKEIAVEIDESKPAIVFSAPEEKKEVDEYQRLLNLAGSAPYTYHLQGNVVKISAQDISTTCYIHEEELLSVNLPSKIEQSFQKIVAGAGYNLAFDITNAFFNDVAKHTTIPGQDKMQPGDKHCEKAYAAIVGTIKAINQGRFDIVQNAIDYFLQKYKKQKQPAGTSKSKKGR